MLNRNINPFHRPVDWIVFGVCILAFGSLAECFGGGGWFVLAMAAAILVTFIWIGATWKRIR